MSVRILLCRLGCAAGVALSAARGQSPANPHADASARAILSYFYGLRNGGATRVVSGQWLGYGPAASLDQAQAIARQTGRWPALVGVSYTDYGDNGISPAVPNALAESYWNRGGLVEVDCHFATSPNGNGLSDTTVDLTACVTPGTPQYAAYTGMLDQVAAGLQQLQQAGVAVLWRPLHEMNGNWFWWGGKDPAAFKQLWQFTFDYLTNRKGLNNLLWVYSPYAQANAADYYPGDASVDLVGFAAYGSAVDPSDLPGYSQLVALGKPFAFAEYGPGSTFTPPPANFDFAQFITGVKSSFPPTVYFMTWDGTWSPAANPDSAGLYDNPAVIDRAGLDADLFGSGSRLSNLSVLNATGPGSAPLTLGFVISGSGTEPVLARGVGPGLASYNVTGALADPRLQLYSGATVVAANAGWTSGNASALVSVAAQVGAFALPAGSLDAALTTSLSAGPYTVAVTGASGDQGTALAELYDATSSAGPSSARFINLSALAPTGSGGIPLTVGFSITGSTPKRVLVRAIGPGLAPYGVSGALPHPQLQLFHGDAVMQSNAGWGGDAALADSFAQVGAFPLASGSADAALETTLAPGSYTVQVSDAGGASGMALAEVYELP